MLFDNKLQKHDITYTKEDPRMINYLEEIMTINNKYQDKFIELKENMNIIRTKSIKEDTQYQFYAECVCKYLSDITEEFCNLSEEINNVYDKFSESYSTLSESENIILENMSAILAEDLYFNGNIYDLSLEKINLTEDMLMLKDTILNERFLKLYIEDVKSDAHYDIIRGKILNMSEAVNRDTFNDTLQNKLLISETFKARLTKKEKEFLLESVLNNEKVVNNGNIVINSINNHYCNVIEYFNEMSNINSDRLDTYIGNHILAEAKLTECMNVLAIYNETLGLYLNTVNKQSTEYSEFFNKTL